MKSDPVLFNSEDNYKSWDAPSSHPFSEQYALRVQEENLPEILFITSFPPRECGIATYSQDLVNAINNQFEDSFLCSICALESDDEQHTYKQQPKYSLNVNAHNSFIKIADSINKDENIKLVIMQHEFGFFANKEKEYKYFFRSITKPIVFVFHTVLPNPNEELKTKVQEMSDIASSIIVMTKNAADILKNEYDVTNHKISIIPHGTHLVPPLDREEIKKQYQFNGRKILSTFGLLSSSKSIETTLRALPAVIKVHPAILFLVLGKTHPTIKKHEGEKYRLMLEEIVSELNLESSVMFVNEYLKLPILLEYLQLTDIYLFTSKDPNQAVSGTFSYAVSSGCPVISTPIPHAKEVLNDNNGIIIDFENSGQLSQAIISLLDNDKLREEISSKSFQRLASTVWQNSAIAHMLLFESLTQNAIPLRYRIPIIKLSHIKKMTTDFGMIQFSKISSPDIHSGYTIDDNARALIALCQHYEMTGDTNDFRLINTYMQFIRYCLRPNQKFLNYVNMEKEFTAQNYTENIEDSNGRAIWALGYVCSLKNILPTNLTNEAEYLLQRALSHVDKIHSTRAMAFIIKGLYYQNNPENLYLLEMFANRLVQMYKHERTDEWKWYESYLTYGNSLLPEAMLCAYLATNDKEYREIAKESFDFLLTKIFVSNRIKVISNKGWHIRDSVIETTEGGEQPIDVAYTIMALEKFYTVFKYDEYQRKSIVAFNWFLGDNHLNQIIYNPCTGGCYDGLEEHNVNLNQGAESTVSYLIARLVIGRLVPQDTEILC